MASIIYLNIIFFDFVVLLSGLPNEQDWYTVEKKEGISEWVELREHDRSIRLDLTDEYLAYMNRSLPFEFPFYGEDFTNLKITTQGFICLSDIVIDTQYIGPLAANFKPLPKGAPTQYIGVLYNSDSVIIQWGDMQLAKQSSVGMFNFQLKLDVSGAIFMLYKTVPIPVDQIEADGHFVSAGISGGHPMGQTVPIPYSTISLTDVTPNSTYILTPRATCMDQMDCTSCTNWSSMCRWCESIQQCSTGQDRVKNKWLQNSCYATSTRHCSAATTSLPTSTVFHSFSTSPDAGFKSLPPSPEPTEPKNKNYTIDNNPDTTADPRTKPPDITSPISLPVIYVILIVASSLSFFFVVAAFVILIWHKRRINLLRATLISSQPETNNLISDRMSNGHDHSNGDHSNGDHNGSVKC